MLPSVREKAEAELTWNANRSFPNTWPKRLSLEGRIRKQLVGLATAFNTVDTVLVTVVVEAEIVVIVTSVDMEVIVVKEVS